MDDQELSPQARLALDDLLEGEFDFFGLISTKQELLAPVIRWKYEQITEQSLITVECRSREGVPHGDDVAVYRTLLQLYAYSPGALVLKPLEVTVRAFQQQLAAVYPEITLTDELLYQSLYRLMDSTCIVDHVPRTDGVRTSRRWVFAFLMTLISVPVQEEAPDRLEAFMFTVPASALSLYDTGQLDES